MQDLESFFSQLSDRAKELIPVSYRTLGVSSLDEAPVTRYAESTRYRSERYNCFGFNKPISRILQPLPRENNRCALAEPWSPGDPLPATSADRVFLLFACCVLVVGARRSSICDLQRGTFQLIPNSLAEILKIHRGKTLAAIKEVYHHRYDRQITEYFDFLIAHELGFWCDDPEAFPELDLNWCEPERITNALLDVDEYSDHDFGAILHDLDDLGCKALQVRIYSGGRLPQLRALLAAARGTCLRAIDLVLPFHIEDTEENYRHLCLEFPRISHLLIHSALQNQDIMIEPTKVPLIYRVAPVDSPHCCGIVHPSYFSINIKTFTEAQSHNSCLSRKISIDRRGEIGNCPSLPMSFGNIRNTSLHSVLARRDFRELWSINKDQIEICRDCEFRHICVDCRAYLTRPDDRYSKPANCTYDPYTAQWGRT